LACAISAELAQAGLYRLVRGAGIGLTLGTLATSIRQAGLLCPGPARSACLPLREVRPLIVPSLSPRSTSGAGRGGGPAGGPGPGWHEGEGGLDQRGADRDQGDLPARHASHHDDPGGGRGPARCGRSRMTLPGRDHPWGRRPGWWRLMSAGHRSPRSGLRRAGQGACLSSALPAAGGVPSGKGT